MKAILMSLTLLLSVFNGAQAQPLNSAPAYWVVETNVFFRDCTIVKFYDQQNQLVHEVKIMGVYIDISKPKQKRKLDELLKNYNERLIISAKKGAPKPELISTTVLTY